MRGYGVKILNAVKAALDPQACFMIGVGQTLGLPCVPASHRPAR